MRWRSAAGWAEGVWAFALALLLVNDHVLKGSGWLPGVVTGKLSDFAGLVVAPVLVAVLVALAGLRGPRVRLVCFAAMAVPFAAIKLSTDAARAFESMLALAGVPSRVCSDPTDLVALAVLPFAWRVSVSLEARVTEIAPRLRHVLGAMLGGVACLASLDDDDVSNSWRYETSAYLVSAARASVTVEVSRVTAALDCTALDETVSALDANDFEPTFCADVSPTDVLPLDRIEPGLPSFPVHRTRVRLATLHLLRRGRLCVPLNAHRGHVRTARSRRGAHRRGTRLRGSRRAHLGRCGLRLRRARVSHPESAARSSVETTETAPHFGWSHAQASVKAAAPARAEAAERQVR